jgi:secreted trypsin-like serine protease
MFVDSCRCLTEFNQKIETTQTSVSTTPLTMMLLVVVTAITFIILAQASVPKGSWTQISGLRSSRLAIKSDGDLKVMGATEVKPHSIPFQVFLNTTIANSNVFCGGTLITTRTSLTAARCIFGGKSSQIILGAHNRAMMERSQQRHIVSGDNLRVHEDYHSGGMDFDIGLVILEKPVEINEFVQTAELPIRFPNENFIDEIGTISGWGQLYQNSRISKVLMAFSGLVISSEACHDVYPDSSATQHICIDGGFMSQACNGDYGGPLTVLGGGRLILVGISIFSQPRCRTGAPTGEKYWCSILDFSFYFQLPPESQVTLIGLQRTLNTDIESLN